MGQQTDIQWCDSTVNPTTGCDGCELWSPTAKGTCYAGLIHERRLARSLPALYAADFAEVRLAPGRMAKVAAWPDLAGTDRPDKPWLDGMPRTIFVGDMGDIFSRGVPFEYLRDEVIGAALSSKGRRHIWMLLSKQAHRSAAFARWLADEQGIAWPDNVWAGVSVTSAVTQRRAEIVAGHPASVKFLSVEPMLGPIAFRPEVLAAYRMVIVGGESGAGAKARTFDLAWARHLLGQCRAVGTGYFLKQVGRLVVNTRRPGEPDSRWGDTVRFDAVGRAWTAHPAGADPDEWPPDLRVREFPRPAMEAAS